MNHDTNTNWTVQELELYHDDELDAARRDALTAALRREPALRERLAALQSLDALTRAALVSEPVFKPAGVRGFAGSRRFFRFAVPAAAAVLLAAVLGWHWRAGSNKAMTPLVDSAAPRVVKASPVTADYEPIRVVFSTPARPARPKDKNSAEARPQEAAKPTKSAKAADADEKPFAARLNEALAAGRVPEALELLDQASPAEREFAHRRLGEILRSADAAERLLDSLPPAEQLAVVGDWVKSPRLRPVAFARLGQLSQNAALNEKIVPVVDRMRADPALRPWLRSYRVAPDAPPTNDFPG